ncbi:MAG: FHA domain-containing protein [Gemmataceae bacterium]
MKPSSEPTQADRTPRIDPSESLRGRHVPFVPLRLILEPSGMTIALTQPDVVVGRHGSADLRLPLPDVSRRHCRFVFAESQWRIIDLNSLNGIFVNDQRVRQSQVTHQDRIRIGGFTFSVDLSAVDAENGDDPLARSANILRSIAEALPRAETDKPREERQAS